MSDNLNSIGLDTNKAAQLADQLKVLLAKCSQFYQNTRGYQWNIKGGKFFELHLKFEELYNNLLLKIDEVAERIVTLGHSPGHRYSSYAQRAHVKESAPDSDGVAAVNDILASFKVLITL